MASEIASYCGGGPNDGNAYDEYNEDRAPATSITIQTLLRNKVEPVFLYLLIMARRHVYLQIRVTTTEFNPAASHARAPSFFPYFRYSTRNHELWLSLANRLYIH